MESWSQSLGRAARAAQHAVRLGVETWTPHHAKTSPEPTPAWQISSHPQCPVFSPRAFHMHVEPLAEVHAMVFI